LRKALLTTLFYFVVVLAAASPAVTEPPVPSWLRGSGGTTFQEWSFDSNDVAPEPNPDTLFNPFATVANPVQLYVDSDHGWYGSIDQGQGVWALSGEMDIVIPNSIEPNPYKEILLYLVWKPEENDPTGAPFDKDPFLPDAPSVGVVPFLDGRTFDVTTSYTLGNPDSDGWYHSSYTTVILPNPLKEYINIRGNILVDHIAIDTICVPEPATIVVVTVGGLFARQLGKFKN
jgi:hypothetical protein